MSLDFILIIRGSSHGVYYPTGGVSKPMVVWDKGGKVSEVPFTIGVRKMCVYLKPFCKWSRDESPSQLMWGWYIAHKESLSGAVWCI